MLLAMSFSYYLLMHSEWSMVWSGRGTTENWIIKGMAICGIAIWKLLWEFEGYIKVGYVSAHQKNPLLAFVDDWN